MDRHVPAELGQFVAELVGCVEDLDDAVPGATLERALDGRGDGAGDRPLVGGLGGELIYEEDASVGFKAMRYKRPEGLKALWRHV